MRNSVLKRERPLSPLHAIPKFTWCAPSSFVSALQISAYNSHSTVLEQEELETQNVSDLQPVRLCLEIDIARMS